MNSAYIIYIHFQSCPNGSNTFLLGAACAHNSFHDVTFISTFLFFLCTIDSGTRKRNKKNTNCFDRHFFFFIFNIILFRPWILKKKKHYVGRFFECVKTFANFLLFWVVVALRFFRGFDTHWTWLLSCAIFYLFVLFINHWEITWNQLKNLVCLFYYRQNNWTFKDNWCVLQCDVCPYKIKYQVHNKKNKKPRIIRRKFVLMFLVISFLILEPVFFYCLFVLNDIKKNENKL